MAVLLGLHLAVGVAIIAAGRHAQRWAIPLAAVAPAATVAWLGTRLPAILDGRVTTEHVEWVPQLGLALDLRLDGFAATMLVLVAGIGVLVVAYSAGYFTHRDERSTRLMGLLVLFAGSMVGLVLADNLIVLYGFWELTSITSFLLIGNRNEDAAARAAALQALLMTGIGGLAMLGGFVVLGQAAGTYRLSELLADPPSGASVSVALVLILLGAFTKSAQYPFHSWLPGAMVAPTPVSAYLHSATMVKAGVYLVARLAPAFADVGLWRPLVVAVGAVTMVGGGLRALRQSDLKLLLAMGTISQLGFMTVVLGWGSPSADVAGSVLLLAHGAYKAAAFMVVGIIEHQTGTRDVRRIPPLERAWRPLLAVMAAAAASMAGLPLFLGFVSKEYAFEALADSGRGGALALGAVAVGSVFTAAYSVRFVLGITGRLREPDAADAADRAAGGAPAPSVGFLAPAAVLSTVTVLLGVWPGVLDELVDASAGALVAVTGRRMKEVHLTVWHGVSVALVLSALALAAGLALALASRRLEPLLRAGAALPSSTEGYRASLRGLNALANRVTTVTQPGSLPIYLGVILLTAFSVPAIAMFRRAWWPGWPELVDTPVHLAVAALLVGFSLAAAIVHRRFSAALFLGMAGYSMAGLFLATGAPDLALTQVAIETLTTVLFVLVLRRLPDRFEVERAFAHRPLRRLVAGVVAALAFAFTLAVSNPAQPTTVSDAIVADAFPEGHGRNVVNVILVDFRGFDTMGEVTVLAAGAIGTVALARAAGRRRDVRSAVPAPDDVAHPRRAEPRPRLVTVEVSVRIVVAAVIAGSLWLLFAGHNQPGGGFVGGIVAGAAVALRYVGGGIEDVRRISRGRPWFVLGGGVVLAVVVAIVPVLLGHSVLEATAWTWDVPVLGTVKLASALFFDIGVYIAVVGTVLMAFESFGDEARPTAGDLGGERPGSGTLPAQKAERDDSRPAVGLGVGR